MSSVTDSKMVGKLRKSPEPKSLRQQEYVY